MKQATGLKKQAIHLTANVLRLTNGLPFSAIYAGLGQILMFHRVLPPSDRPRLWNNAYLEVTPHFLENVINYYKDLKYTFLSLDELYQTVFIGHLPRRFVVFTFDDGYRDNLTHALPVLKKHKVPMTLYITTSFPDRTALLWWYSLENKILGSDTITFSFAGKKYSYTARSQPEKEQLFQHIARLIQSTPAEQKQILLNTIFTDQELLAPQDSLLSWDEIRQIASDDLVTIGAHTVNHLPLSQLTDDQSTQEILQSIQAIEHRIDKPVRHFAYPFGAPDTYGTREINILQNAGIHTAVTTISKNITRHSLKNLFTLPRIAVGMSMDRYTFDLIRFGLIPMIRNKGRR